MSDEIRDKHYFPNGYDYFPFADDLNYKLDNGILVVGKSVTSDWVSKFTNLELSLFLKMLEKICDDVHDLDDVSEIVLLIVRLYFMETGEERFEMAEESLFECMSLCHFIACVEGMSRNHWVEYRPIGITHEEVYVQPTEKGKKMLTKIMKQNGENIVEDTTEETYDSLNLGLKKFFEENVDKWKK